MSVIGWDVLLEVQAGHIGIATQVLVIGGHQLLEIQAQWIRATDSRAAHHWQRCDDKAEDYGCFHA